MVKLWHSCRHNVQIVLTEKLFSFKEWIILLIEVAQFVSFLHSKNYLLLTPLESCMLIDCEQLQPKFYFFDYFDSLAYRLNNLSSEKKLKWSDIYPISEIKK